MSKNFLLQTFVFVFFSISSTVFAATVLPMDDTDLTIGQAESLFASGVVFSDIYRLGSVWGKKPVTPQDFMGESAVFQRTAMATAKAGGGTAFYLGKFQGYHVMATNHHVFPDEEKCLGKEIIFPLLGIQAVCSKVIGSWTDIELTLFIIRVRSTQDEQALEKAKINFAFHAVPEKDTPLLTIGYGIADNPMRTLVASQDADCRVVSHTDESRYIADPDNMNPMPYQVWSFAHACDLSHGDSGSAVVNRETGDVLGITWTGGVPKIDTVKTSDGLLGLQTQDSPMLWTQLSYAVPATKIYTFLKTFLDQNQFDAKTTKIIRDLVGETAGEDK